VIVSDGRIEALERGMTPMQAIQSASSIAATHMGWSDRVGALGPGRYGDLIAVRCDPLEGVSCLQAVDVVVKGGLVFRQPGPER
jgi:imidazolonepropionase-like amidohydrolase